MLYDRQPSQRFLRDRHPVLCLLVDICSRWSRSSEFAIRDHRLRHRPPRGGLAERRGREIIHVEQTGRRSWEVGRSNHIVKDSANLTINKYLDVSIVFCLDESSYMESLWLTFKYFSIQGDIQNLAQMEITNIRGCFNLRDTTLSERTGLSTP